MNSAYRVEFVKSAVKEFEKLPDKIQDKILEAVRLISMNPRSELLNIKRLKGTEDAYRIRLGDYRILYEIKDEVLLVLVIKIGHRRDVYR